MSLHASTYGWPLRRSGAGGTDKAARRRARLWLIDGGRGIAVLLMVIYHFSWDLNFFGLTDFPMFTDPAWLAFRTLIAGGFLFFAGFSLVLAGTLARPMALFWRRLGVIAACALIITVASLLTFPNAYIFFGILHCIALGSVLGLAALRAPLWLVAAAALFVLFAGPWLSAPLFDEPWLWWLGLVTVPPLSNDYVPLFPWFGFILAGIAAARWLRGRGSLGSAGWPAFLAWRPPEFAASGLAFAGRHSLFIYMAHQPILIGALWLYFWLAGLGTA